MINIICINIFIIANLEWEKHFSNVSVGSLELERVCVCQRVCVCVNGWMDSKSVWVTRRMSAMNG